VCVAGEDVQALDPIRLRRRIGFVVQRGGLFPHLTVTRNIELLCELEGWSRTRINARVETLLDLLGLPREAFGDRYPYELSGGQQQRVGIARALALDPQIVLMDEPFGALDPITRREIHAEFLRLCRELDKTIILVTHDMHEAFKLGHRIALMRDGRIEQVGTAKELVERPATDFVRHFVRPEPLLAP
jgi:osmoprotectant transport system ATP-binding protein